jgi:putative peptidoglycan lipid II flippase
VLSKILSVGGWTLVSRVTGFLRDACMAAIMGAGPVTDAFVVAMRIPNHFRAIFAEGAFNAAFIPKYSRLLAGADRSGAALFAAHIFSLVLMFQAVILVLALIGMPWLVYALTFGFPEDPSRYDLAVALSRITFPYLLFVTLVTVLSGILNAHGRFAAAAAAPVIMNVTMVAALLVSVHFPTAGHAAAWGFCLAGVLEFLLLYGAVRRAGLSVGLKKPVLSPDMREFFRALGPAVIGSAGIQIAMFADTLIASLLPTGAVSSIYYADRLYQLPVGVIAIAVGTVLLPEMSRKLGTGDESGAFAAQNRAAALTFVLTVPFFVAFLTLPDLILTALFKRGAFNFEAARAAADVLFAYAAGLPAVMLIRSAVAGFYARQDTRTPVIASLIAVALNVVLKIILVGPLGAPGLALATSLGAWLNLGILLSLGLRRRTLRPDRSLALYCLAAALAALPLAAFALTAPGPAAVALAGYPWPEGLTLMAVGAAGALLYAAALVALFKLFRLRLKIR